MQIINIYNWVDIGSPLFPTASIEVRKAERQTQPCKILKHNMACRWHRAAINKPGLLSAATFFPGVNECSYFSFELSVLTCTVLSGLSSVP